MWPKNHLHSWGEKEVRKAVSDAMSKVHNAIYNKFGTGGERERVSNLQKWGKGKIRT